MNISDAAKAYKKLLNFEYDFIIVKNRHSSLTSLNFSFPKSRFFHLCGLHKLTDIGELQFAKINKEEVFDKIINGTYPDTLFKKSVYYDTIQDRIDCLVSLESILDDKKTNFYKYNSSQKNRTSINFNFLIKNASKDGRQYYLAVENNEKQSSYVGCSCFGLSLEKVDYAQGHTLCSVLQKTKINCITHEKTELYIAPSYKKQLEAESSTAAREVETNIKKIEFVPLPVSPVITLDRPKFRFSFSDFFQKIKRAFRHFLSYFKPKKPQASAQKRSSHSRTRT